MGDDIDTAELMDLCLADNDRRLDGHHRRLQRPQTVPHLVRFAQRFMRVPKTSPASRAWAGKWTKAAKRIDAPRSAG